MNREEFLNFRAMWVADDVDWEELASLEGDDRVDGSDPKQRAEYMRLWGADDVTLKMCYLDFEHAGRYSMKFRNQGFDTSSFSKTHAPDDEDGVARSYFYNYVTSTDVCYYDAEFESRSRMAYDVAMYAEAFRNVGEFNRIADELGKLFSALVAEDLDAFNREASWLGAELGPDGSVRFDCYKRFDVIFDLKVFPAS